MIENLDDKMDKIEKINRIMKVIHHYDGDMFFRMTAVNYIMGLLTADEAEKKLELIFPWQAPYIIHEKLHTSPSSVVEKIYNYLDLYIEYMDKN